MNIRIVAGIAMIMASIPLYAGGGFVAWKAIDEKHRQEVQAMETDSQCLHQLQDIPNAKVQNGEDITVTIAPLSDPKEALTTASMAIMQCPTRDLTFFCLGDKCDVKNNDVTMVMTFARNKGH